MKKSEKIEVRLSHDEKQKLTDIADGEGRTVSELVRGLISRYMAVNTPLIKKTAWGKIAAVAIAGVLLGHLGTWAVMAGHHSQSGTDPQFENWVDVYELNVIATNILTDGRLASNALKMPITARHGYDERFVMGRQGDDLQIDVKVTIKDGKGGWIDVTICRQTKKPPEGEACKYLAHQRLIMIKGSDASVEIATEESDSIAIGLEFSGETQLENSI